MTNDARFAEFLPYAYAIAYRVTRLYGLDRSTAHDVRQVAAIGLLDALAKYQAVRGTPFNCYARRRIKGSVLDWLRESVPGGRKAAKAGHPIPVESLTPYLDSGKDDAEVDADPGESGSILAVAPPDNQADAADAWSRIDAVLPPRVALTLRLLYRDGLTRSEAALSLGYCPERVWLWHREGLRLIRSRFTSDELADLLGVAAA